MISRAGTFANDSIRSTFYFEGWNIAEIALIKNKMQTGDSGNKSMFHGIIHQSGNIFYIQLQHQIGAVRIHGAGADKEFFSDLAAGIITLRSIHRRRRSSTSSSPTGRRPCAANDCPRIRQRSRQQTASALRHAFWHVTDRKSVV